MGWDGVLWKGCFFERFLGDTKTNDAAVLQRHGFLVFDFAFLLFKQNAVF